jgi:hypothetical protein
VRSPFTFRQFIEGTSVAGLNRLNAIRPTGFAMLLILPATSGAQLPPIAEQMAKTYGLDSFGQVEAIRYTVNKNLPGGKVSRTWKWEPKTDTVSYDGPDEHGKPLKVTYQRSALSSQSDIVKNEVDPAFINDNYVFLFPLYVAWDGASVTDQGMQEAPIGKTSAELIVVKYPSQGGYSPGDIWELYVGADKRLEEFIYHRGGRGNPGVVTQLWAGHKKVGPLLVSTDRQATVDGKPARISYSNVSVKVTGSDDWIDAH